jgi:hypothetical protein
MEMKAFYEKSIQGIGHSTTHCKNHLRIYKHKDIKYHPKIFTKSFSRKRLNE